MQTNYFEFRERLSYERALRYQSFLLEEGYSGLFSFECDETITLGKSADFSDVLVSTEYLRARNVRVLSTDRGGRATWHGPGQLVGFPLIDLKKQYGHSRAVRRFTEELMMGLTQACSSLGVKEISIKNNLPGLWTPKGKLVSLGLAVKDGFIHHGFAINVTNQVRSGFSLISACGQTNAKLTSLEEEGVSILNLQDVSRAISRYLPMLFSLDQKSSFHKHEERYDELVRRVARTNMAYEHLSKNLKAMSQSAEK